MAETSNGGILRYADLGLTHDPAIDSLAVAICAMKDPPSWDEAVRIARHLVTSGSVRLATAQDPA